MRGRKVKRNNKHTKQYVTIQMPKLWREALEERAVKYGMTVSEMIRFAVYEKYREDIMKAEKKIFENEE